MNSHTCTLYTARINYRAQEGETILNTTVKSGTGLGAVFAPTWDLVMQSKNNRITWDEYTAGYTQLLRERYRANPAPFLTALQTPRLVITCYCADTSTSTRHCHRYLLVEILQKIAAHHGISCTYAGERR